MGKESSEKKSTKNKLNLLEHELVPMHIVLSEEEAEEVLKTYKINRDQLPKLLASDPIAKLINAKPGDIVKIIRKSPTSETFIAYRYVIKG
ncbi:MAG: DNA-directed RNA polymerase subunit H [Candidatus Odinarchaeia archaeon]